MVYHAARVTSLAWASDGGQLASGSLDGNIILWDMQKPSSARVTLSNAHREGVTALAWSGDLVSCGADACVRFWATK
jgi:WD40 repeat protein